MTTITVQRATADLLTEVVAIERRSFSDPWSLPAFEDVVEHSHVAFLCARDGIGGPVLGYVVAWFAADEAEIANLAVAAQGRRRGIGSALLAAALEEAQARGAVAVYLEVRDSNVAARRLYESHGFTEVGKRKAYYRKPVEDAIVLKRELVSEAKDKA